MHGVREPNSKIHRATLSVHKWNLDLVYGTPGAAYMLNQI